MKERRAKRAQVTPLYEDQGIFRNSLQSISVWLTPEVSRNRRNDIVVRGHYMHEGTERMLLEVIFAGRRVRYAEPLLKLLRRQHEEMRLMAGGAAVPASKAILAFHIQGAWRYRFETDNDGWQNRHRQFMVAQWSPIGKGKQPVIGEPPVLSGRQPTKQAPARPRVSASPQSPMGRA
jgi:hypothetical protein